MAVAVAVAVAVAMLELQFLGVLDLLPLMNP
jgi:hypothetical protein